MHQFHLAPSLMLSFDGLLDQFHFPVVPFFKAGLIGSLYAWTHDAEWDTRGSTSGHTPAGFRFGTEMSGGILVALDFVEPRVTRRARATGTYNHAFFFAEVSRLQIDGLGIPGLVLSPEDIIFQTEEPLMVRLGISLELP